MEAAAIPATAWLRTARWIPALLSILFLGLGIAFLPPLSRPLANPLLGAQSAASALRGEGPRADFAADYVSARAVLRDEDPYPREGAAFRKIGLAWNLKGRSTHPPTAFVFALPLTTLSWPVAEAVWTALMLLAFVGSFVLLGLAPERAVPIGVLALLWPPAAWSLQQLTPIWLLAVACTYRWRERPTRAGLMIGLAALTKLTPAVLVVPFLLRRQWKALWATLAVLTAALATILALEPSTLGAYLSDGRRASVLQLGRPDNGGFVPAAYHALGIAGLISACACLLAAGVAGVLWRSRREAWWIWPWLSVAILPIAWIYSLLPLLPGLIKSTRVGPQRAIALPPAWIAIAVPFFFVPFGTAAGAYGFAVATLLAGVAAVLSSGERSPELAPPAARLAT